MTSDKQRKKLKLSAYDRIVGMFARRDHSEREVVQKLKLKHTPEEISQALQKAKQQSWWPDTQLLSQRTVEQLQRKNKSSSYIRAYLKKKGLSFVQIDSEKEDSSALYHVTKLLRGEKLNPENKMRIARSLQRRGFSNNAIKKAFQKS